MTTDIRLFWLLLAAVGCGDSDVGTSDQIPGLSGVGQGGAQDFGLFRQILDDGGIPGPETLDDVGFFNEHVIPLPTPTCGEDVCLHGVYGTMGNMISGSPCTVVLLGMNTTLTPETVERPPLNLTVVVDTSGSMDGEPINAVRSGLRDMLLVLEEGDTVSIVGFSETAEILVDRLAPTDEIVRQAIADMRAGGGTNLYDGLRQGYALAEAGAVEGVQTRLMLLSDGVSNRGITSPERARELSRGYAERGFGLSTIGLGTEFDVELMRELAEQGAGAFYFLEDPAAVEEVFRQEAEVFMIPLAETVEIDLDVSGPWDVRGVYGTRQAYVEPRGAEIDIASVQLAGRASDPGNPAGRRGGGGAMLVELLPNGGGPTAGEVGTLDFRYRSPGTDDIVTQEIVVNAPDDEVVRFFGDASVEKSFVMLNLYVGFQMAAESAAGGNDGAALGVLDALELNVGGWVQTNEDADIIDDLRYVRRFIENLETRSGQINRPELIEEPWAFD